MFLNSPTTGLSKTKVRRNWLQHLKKPSNHSNIICLPCKISKSCHWGLFLKWHFCVFLLIWRKELLSELTKQYHHDPDSNSVGPICSNWDQIRPQVQPPELFSQLGPVLGQKGPLGPPVRTYKAPEDRDDTVLLAPTGALYAI